MSNPVPSDKISDGKLNFGTADVMVNSDDHTVTTRTGKVIRTFAGINAEFDAAQAGQFVAASQDAADRAETAAEVAAAAGRVYEASTAGQADSELVDGDYFWVVSAEDSEVLELWRKGASSPTDTGKRTISRTHDGRIKATAGIDNDDVVTIGQLKGERPKSIPVSHPQGFDWVDYPVLGKIFTDGRGKFFVEDFDASDLQHVGAGVTYYVNRTSGSNSNDGLTPSTAFQSISKARAMPDVDVIIVAGGFYTDVDGFNNSILNSKNITIKAAEGEDVIISTMRGFFSWTKVDGYTNVYSTTRSLAKSVLDVTVLDDEGDFYEFAHQESIEAVDSTAGSFFISGSTVYVHALNSSAPHGNVRINLDIYNFYNQGNFTTYLENLKIYGGKLGAVYAESTAGGNLFVAKNCEFKYATAGAGGVRMLNTKSVLQNCIVARNALDGINYGGWASRGVEIDCVGRHNGIGRGVNQDNGSTAHDNSKVIRINGEYYNNEGPNIHDIHANTQSWNLNTRSHTSVATSADRNANYRIESGGQMWLDSPVSYNSAEVIRVGADSIMRIRNPLIYGNEVVNGTKESY